MSIRIIIDIVGLLLWFIMAGNVFYILFFALASLLPKRTCQESSTTHQPSGTNSQPYYLILFPAYQEDAVILHSVTSFLQQDYPKERYQVVVISDNMSQEANDQLSALPITLIHPNYENSSKAKALQLAMQQSSKADYVIVLDADNIVAPDFLTQLNLIASPDIAIQCHRTAKNVNNDIAALDGLSEEINNSIFRKGHNRIGMSSALIGSGMCFSYDWFKEEVSKLNSAVEDRELEALLMKQRIYIHYADDILVLDEKVSSDDNFQRQRLRWMTGQVQALFRMLPYVPKAIITGNINYIDKTIQQALIPRSILLFIIPMFGILSTIIYSISSHTSHFVYLKWWFLFALIILALYCAIPKSLRTKALFKKTLSMPKLVWRLTQNIVQIKPKNKDFIHTQHHQSELA